MSSLVLHNKIQAKLPMSQNMRLKLVWKLLPILL